MKKYRLLEGSHIVGKVVYRAGSIIATEEPLDEIYPGRFEEAERGDAEPFLVGLAEGRWQDRHLFAEWLYEMGRYDEACGQFWLWKQGKHPLPQSNKINTWAGGWHHFQVPNALEPAPLHCILPYMFPSSQIVSYRGNPYRGPREAERRFLVESRDMVWWPDPMDFQNARPVCPKKVPDMWRRRFYAFSSVRPSPLPSRLSDILLRRHFIHKEWACTSDSRSIQMDGWWDVDLMFERRNNPTIEDSKSGEQLGVIDLYREPKVLDVPEEWIEIAPNSRTTRTTMQDPRWQAPYHGENAD